MSIDHNIVIHCGTQAESDEFCKLMYILGNTLRDGKSYLDCNLWDKYEEDTCYSFNGTFADLDCYKAAGYEVVEWSDYKESLCKKYHLEHRKDF